ncbi:ANTAR domain-containing protein [Arthrobacter sp. AET 35A]|uniref:ANTAR domain-containing protein n=1 Tax=Arthrobacter sp. AET 35A TaxID=2292643 RepID=UPI00177F3A5F|nr:ANTAR domain-containing protein [Arthrobacter sp. AET 35A]MBE0011323.1 antitermination regulator [Arthrobacter sp. AET 35A]
MANKTVPELEILAAKMCASYLDALPVTGAALSALGGSLQETTLWATDALAGRLDELQFDLGEGPRWAAIRSRSPVLIPGVHDASHERWPVFGKALLETNAQALFVFPLVVGAVDVGVVELYRAIEGPLSPADLATARGLSDRAAWSLLGSMLALGSVDGSGESDSVLSRREIHQATGMVLAQTGGSAADALLMLRAHAFANGLTLRETCDAVLARTLDFGSDRG